MHDNLLHKKYFVIAFNEACEMISLSGFVKRDEAELYRDTLRRTHPVAYMTDKETLSRIILEGSQIVKEQVDNQQIVDTFIRKSAFNN